LIVGEGDLLGNGSFALTTTRGVLHPAECEAPNSAASVCSGPGLTIDYLIFDHSASIMTLSEKLARVVGHCYQSIHLLLGAHDQDVLKISRRSVVEIEARSSESQAAQVVDHVKGRSIP